MDIEEHFSEENELEGDTKCSVGQNTKKYVGLSFRTSFFLCAGVIINLFIYFPNSPIF